jgi:hypothetical protein
VVEVGPHDELMAKQGRVLAALYEAQARELDGSDPRPPLLSPCRSPVLTRRYTTLDA